MHALAHNNYHTNYQNSCGCGGQIFLLTNIHNMTRVGMWEFLPSHSAVVNDNYEHLFAPCKAP